MHPFNLLTEAWIPVRRVDGKRLVIPPWRIADPGDGSDAATIADIDSPRPDFKGALLEFLIGLLQTACPPENIRQWRLGFEKAPSPEALQNAFTPLRPAFNLFGERPRFMQDLTLGEAEAREPSPVAALLMDSPGENAGRNNSDIFIKRDEPPEVLCPACAATALFTLQTYAPSGGVGYRVSLRGGGPLTTIVIIKENLWKTVWANVLPLQTTDAAPLPDTPADFTGKVFPWLAPTRESSVKGSELHAQGMHFLHHYWAMPRRIVLLPETTAAPFACPVCGRESDMAVRRYRTRNYGNNYGSGWRHPLTPHRDQKPGQDPLTIKGESEGRAYNLWLGLVYGSTDDKQKLHPAKVVTYYREHMPEALVGVGGLRAFGYDMDNMKARNWCEGEYPIYDLQGWDAETFLGEVTPLVKAAEIACVNLKKAVYEALFSEKAQKPKADATLSSLVQAQFWAATETAFYANVKSALAAREAIPALLEIKKGWRDTLLNAANSIFACVAEDGGAPPQKARQIYAALNRMRAYTYSGCTKILGIPPKKEARHDAA